MVRSLGALLALCLTFIPSACTLAGPLRSSSGDPLDYEITTLNLTRNVGFLKPRETGQLLRIMPLGASITQGIEAGLTDAQDQGYRKHLRDWLRFKGYAVNMVGSRAHGNFKDNQHEGHPGLQVAAIDAASKNSYTTRKPNLVLINAGTNDCVQADDRNFTPLPGGITFVQGTKDRMRAMILNVFNASPGVTVILSTLINNQDSKTDGYVNTANAGYRQLVLEMQGQGFHIELADMNTGWITLAEHSDSTHPNDSGYWKMASVWATAFTKVESKGWLVPPIDLGENGDGSDCYPTQGGFRGPVQTQQGSGYDDGKYVHSSVLEDAAAITYNGAAPRSLVGDWNHFHFAQLVSLGGNEDNGQPADELIRILDPDDRKSNNLPYLSYRTNNGDGSFQQGFITIDIVGQGTPECLSRGVRFGDINGDGLDDFICINQAGSLFVSLNRGGKPPKFEYIGGIRDDIYDQAHVYLGDIDGDGRLDYCGLDGSGGMVCWRNGGNGDAPIAKYGGFWQGMLLDGGGTTFDDNPSFKFDPAAKLHLVDINGDGRADWVYIYSDTSTAIYINQRGSKRDDGKGLHPHWVKVDTGIGGWPNDNNINATMILFGNVFGSGRADLIRVERTGTRFDYKFNLHRNTGSGGRKVKGDGVHYCDMYNRGHDDYLWVWEGGMIDLFENVNPGNEYMWLDHGRILETGVNRKWISFGDWDGDGLCDVLTTDRATGDVQMHRNVGIQNSIPRFEPPVKVVSGGLCPQSYTTGPRDVAVRFGDLDGDARVDYLCMDPNGRTRGWLNTAGGIKAMSPNQIKVSVGFDRANHQWADVSGDGLVDLLWVDKHTGNVQCWINGGIQPALDSSMFWDEQRDIWMPGVERGEEVHFPRLSNSGRADYHWVHPQDGTAWTYFNEACGANGDGNSGGPDDGDITDPGLPTDPNAGNGDGGGSPICPRVRTRCGEYPPQEHIVAFGDSYGAGIGAGKRITDNSFDPTGSCKQGANAASRYFFNTNPEIRNQGKTFDFLSCTGDKMEQINGGVASGGRSLSQIELLNDAQVEENEFSFMLLSIGGNNVGFADVAKWCLMARLPSRCESLLQTAEESVQPGTDKYNDLFEQMKGVYRSLLRLPDSQEKWLVVTGYARFFNAEDQSGSGSQDCATQSFQLAASAPDTRLYETPLLTVQIRSRVNNAVVAFNNMIQAALAAERLEFPEAKLRFVDIDPYFEGYRWCDRDARGNLRSFDSAMMFLPYGPDIVWDPDQSIPITMPREDNLSDGSFNADVGNVDCGVPYGQLSDEQAWVCLIKDIENAGVGYNCDLYPEACALTTSPSSTAATSKHKARAFESLTNWAAYPIMKAFHPKSFIHMRVAEYIELKYPTWQQESDGCPCSVV